VEVQGRPLELSRYKAKLRPPPSTTTTPTTPMPPAAPRAGGPASAAPTGSEEGVEGQGHGQEQRQGKGKGKGGPSPVHASTVFIAGLGEWAAACADPRGSLSALMAERVGPVEAVNVPTDRRTGRYRGTALVQFVDPASAHKALGMDAKALAEALGIIKEGEGGVAGAGAGGGGGAGAGLSVRPSKFPAVAVAGKGKAEGAQGEGEGGDKATRPTPKATSVTVFAPRALRGATPMVRPKPRPQPQGQKEGEGQGEGGEPKGNLSNDDFKKLFA
jgi:hypothetical protein